MSKANNNGSNNGVTFGKSTVYVTKATQERAHIWPNEDTNVVVLEGLPSWKILENQRKAKKALGMACIICPWHIQCLELSKHALRFDIDNAENK